MRSKKKKVIFLIAFIFSVFTVTGFIVTDSIIKNNKKEYLVNISDLPKTFIQTYFQTYSELTTEEKKDALIVISSEKIKDGEYGAKKVIEAPNHQYILQYGSQEEKNIALEELKTDKKIDSVEENGVYTTEEGDYNSWGIEKTSLDHAVTFANNNIDNMQQVTVAIIDTGCDMSLFNEYYSGKIVEFYNVLEQSTTVMVDEHGHGTHVAGTIAEGTPDNVKILPIKVSRDGNMYYSDIIAAINYVVYNENAQVINMSFGGYGYNEALEQAIESAREKNIISVAAAGNDNTSKRHYPSAFKNTISVASVDSDLNKSTFSNYGEEITFTAPGTNIRSIMGKDTSLSKRNDNNDDDDHEIISGTSMATPHAVSAVAILKGYNKNLTFENVVDILKENAKDLGEQGWDQYYGNGLISFKNVEFCDGTYCDELGVYKDLNKSISSIETQNLSLTKYNYYSITNLMGSKVIVNYVDNTSEELSIGELPNVEISDYDPIATDSQEVTIKVGDFTTSIKVTNPDNYESGWEYNTLTSGKIEITGYKNHNLGIERLYVPDTIDSKQVVAFADNFKFAESGSDIESYTYLYLPSTFTRIGNYSLAGTNIKHIYGFDNKVEVGAHAFENSEIVSIDIPIIKIEDYAFKDCFELLSVKVWKESPSSPYYNELSIGNYAFYNCKKLEKIEMVADHNYNYVGDIGEYAFYNCVSLSFFDLKPGTDIGEYAFYNTFLLSNISLENSDSIGKYAFYSSGISKLGVRNTVINESSFENCKNLKEVDIGGLESSGRIESRAFWGSGVEIIHLNDVEYIAEDAFAYAPIKGSNGTTQNDGIYQEVTNLGIVENGNKLLVGYTDAFINSLYDIPASNTKITEDITEIGNYAFAGNNNLEKIIIPANVTKIGTHAFENCYNLSDVYMSGYAINFGDDTFKRAYEGEIKGADFKIYVHKDSEIKQFVKNKNLNYRHIEPDEIVVKNYEDTYEALSKVDKQKLEVKLIYHEEEEREEVLESNRNVGYMLYYQDYINFKYGDNHFVIEAKNAVGYSLTKKIEVTVEKATPTYTIPTDLTANLGQQLSEIDLPEHFEWMDGNQTITESGEVRYKTRYVPKDTKNYKTIENIEISINVSIPKYTLTFDANGGTGTMNEQVFTYDTLQKITKNTFTKDKYTFAGWNTESDGSGTSYTDEEEIKLTDNLTLYAQWEKETYTLTFDANGGTGTMNKQVFTYDTLQKITKNAFKKEGYTFTGWNTEKDGSGEMYTDEQQIKLTDNLTVYAQWKESYSYIINKYSYDDKKKIIDKIDINTTVNNFKKNIKLNTEYDIKVDYKTIDSKNLLYTGGKTKIYKGNSLLIEYKNIIRGEVTGDGKINYLDYVNVYNHIQKVKHPESDKKALTDVYAIAADFSQDDKVNYMDYVQIYNKIKELKGGTN